MVFTLQVPHRLNVHFI